MDKIKAVVNDPVKLEEELKKAFDKIDTEHKGYISFEALIHALIEQTKALGLPKPEKQPSDEEKAKGRKIADPDGSGKIIFENFKKFLIAAIEKAKAEGKL